MLEVLSGVTGAKKDEDCQQIPPKVEKGIVCLIRSGLCAWVSAWRNHMGHTPGKMAACKKLRK